MELAEIFFVGFLLATGGLIAVWGFTSRKPFEGFFKVAAQKAKQADDQRAIVEAVAIWTENLRDVMSSSSGLEQAIFATESHAPRVINSAVRQLVATLRYGSLEDALRQFADDVSHPTCDFVVAALVTSVQHQTRDLGQLLGHLSECARSECELYLRIWVSRARSRAAVRIITWTIGAFVGGLFIFNRQYLAPFMTREGLVVAVGIAITFGLAISWMNQIARIQTPARFLTGRHAAGLS